MIGLMLLDIWQALWCLPFFSRFIVRIEGCAILEKHDLDKKKSRLKEEKRPTLLYCCMIRIYRYLKEMSTVFWKILQNFANFASFAFDVVFCISAKGIAIINIIDQFFSVIPIGMKLNMELNSFCFGRYRLLQ